MPGESKIEWTDRTWNPVSGCHKVSPGCEHCYAEAISLRFKRSTLPWTKPNADQNVVLHHDRLDLPFRWKKPARIFVNSMSDLFHENVPDGFIAWVWNTMYQTPWHTYQILTKRPERMREVVRKWNDLTGETSGVKLVRGPEATRAAHPSGRGQLFAAYLDELLKASGGVEQGAWPTFDWMEGWRWRPRLPLMNVWLGTSVEDQRRAEERIMWLMDTPATVRFLSCEPLLGPVDLTDITVVAEKPPYGPRCSVNALTGHYPQVDEYHRHERIHWVIVGGESGPGARPMAIDWVRHLRDQCRESGTPVFIKQMGAVWAKQMAADPKGGNWDRWPVDVRVREFPPEFG